MPILNYTCEACEIEFEEVLVQQAEIREFENAHPCPQCHESAPRDRVSTFAFQFAGGVKGESGVHGNSGSHDLDYPSLDKAVGRSAAVKWENVNKRQDARSKARKELGTNSITEVNGKVQAVDSQTMRERQAGLEMFRKAKEITKDKK